MRDRALDFLSQGDVKRAIGLVHSELGRNPADVELRQLLGRIVDFDGKPEAAIRIWREGLAGADSDYPLLLSVADRRRMQSEDGPNVTYRRGSVTYGPSTDADAEATFKRANAERALTAYRQALKLRPDEPTTLAHIGRLEHATGDLEASLKTWASGAKRFPGEVEFQLGWARALREVDRHAEATARFEAATRLDPRSTEAHEGLAELYEKLAQPEKAYQARRRAAFHDWVPRHMEIEFTEESFRRAHELNPRLLGIPSDPDVRERRVAAIRALKRDKSESATAFLAMLCFHHDDHGAVEDGIYAELKTRGAEGERRLFELLRHARSACTARSASHALAEAGSREVLPHLLDALPRDARAYFFADVAGALRKLGDARAVPVLVSVLNAGVEEDKPEGDRDLTNAFTGRLMNRKRCAAALASFDTDEARAALAEGVENPQLALISGVALYAQTRDKRHLKPLESALRKKPSTYGMALAMDVLREVDTDKARELHEALKARASANR